MYFLDFNIIDLKMPSYPDDLRPSRVVDVDVFYLRKILPGEAVRAARFFLDDHDAWPNGWLCADSRLSLYEARTLQKEIEDYFDDEENWGYVFDKISDHVLQFS